MPDIDPQFHFELDSIREIAVARNARRVAVAHDRHVSLIDLSPVRLSTAVPTPASHIAISSTGDRLACAEGSVIEVWTSGGTRQASWSTGEGEVLSLEWTAGDRFICAGRGGGYTVYTPEGTVASWQMLHHWEVCRIKSSRSGTHLAYINHRQGWVSTVDGNLVMTAVTAGLINALAWTHDDRAVVWAGVDGRLRWNSIEGEDTRRSETTGSMFQITDVTLSDDGKWASVRDADGSIALFELMPWRRAARLTEGVPLPDLESFLARAPMFRPYELGSLLQFGSQLLAGVDASRRTLRVWTDLFAPAAPVVPSPAHHAAGHDTVITYNSQDRELARECAARLRSLGIRVWIDVDEVPPGRAFMDYIQAALSSTRTITVLVGQAGLGKHQALEVKASLLRAVEEDVHVIPVLLPGADRLPDPLLFLRVMSFVKFQNSFDEQETWETYVWGVTGKKPE